MAAVRRKSILLGDLFLDLVRQECDHLGVRLACPSSGQMRGSQVSLTHPEGYRVVQALIDRGVVPDFRTPDVLRFGLTPLYQRFVDVWDAVAILREILQQRTWKRPEYAVVAKVT